MTLDDLKAKLAVLDELRQKINAFLIAALQGGLFTDGLKLAAEISKMVAAGGMDPADGIAALGTLTQINTDITTAVQAAKAQAPAA